jgi:hypothetical protein
VIATQANRAQIPVQQFADFVFDGGERLVKSEFQIAGIAESAPRAQVDAGFCPQVRRNGIESHANNGRSPGRSAQPGRVGIEWNAENHRRSGLGRIGTKGHGNMPPISG